MANEKAQPAQLQVKVKNAKGGDAGSVQVDESKLGGMVKNRLMHAATVMYHANMRAGTHCTKTRSEITGSTKKLYRQKGTGRARAGSRKAPQRKHGGTVFGPRPRQYGFEMPKKQRRAAVKSAVLGKVKDGEVQILDSFGLTEVKTKALNEVLKATGLVQKNQRTSLLIVTDGIDKNVWLSARNIEGVSVTPVQDLNAREVIVHKTVAFTKPAFDKFNELASRTYVKRTKKAGGAGGSETPRAARTTS